VTPYFCTYFDRNYLVRALALHDSLRRLCPSSTLLALCLDEETFDLIRLHPRPGLETVSLAELEAADPELAAVRSSRSRVEYYFTCTPSLIRYALDRSDAPLVTYLDADLYFFGRLDSLFDEIGSASAAIIEHRFPAGLEDLERWGRFNVGWVSISSLDEGRACVDWWRSQCLAWCYDRLEDDRFADQKYLDQWPARFRDICVISHKGANVAPWNVNQYAISSSHGRMYVDEDELIFFHFHGLKQRGRWVIDPNLRPYGVKLRGILRHGIYEAYLGALSASRSSIGAAEPSELRALKRGASGAPRREPPGVGSDLLRLGKRAVSGDLLFRLRGNGS
jgi:hypothetical protein